MEATAGVPSEESAITAACKHFILDNDPFMKELIAVSPITALYVWDEQGAGKWVHTGIDEAPMVIYHRYDRPHFSVMLQGSERRSPTTAAAAGSSRHNSSASSSGGAYGKVMPIEPGAFKLQLNNQHIIVYKPKAPVIAYWFPEKEECERIYLLLKLLLDCAQKSTGEEVWWELCDKGDSKLFGFGRVSSHFYKNNYSR